ncbi:hypothetical protein BELL_0140g00130 [Botrytis elliptica]|uniref:Uncharacterized protein n=1 Tax=Botrytis elliptica TaxID=278938 RepID=A0A4Z1K5U3_9HELO|nr:hypothetical protein BELL_0140g00130 [Botrytis elliptica]
MSGALELRAPTTSHSVNVRAMAPGGLYRNSSPNNLQGYNLIGYEQLLGPVMYLDCLYMTSLYPQKFKQRIYQIKNLTILSRASVVPTPSTGFDPWGTRKYIPGTRVTGSYVSSQAAQILIEILYSTDVRSYLHCEQWSVPLPVLHIFIGSVPEPQNRQTLFLLRVQSGSKRN